MLNEDIATALSLYRDRVQALTDAMTKLRDELIQKLSAALQTNDDLAASVVRHSKENARLRAEQRALVVQIEQSSETLVDTVTAAMVRWAQIHPMDQPVHPGCVRELLGMIVDAMPVDRMRFEEVFVDKCNKANEQLLQEAQMPSVHDVPNVLQEIINKMRKPN